MLKFRKLGYVPLFNAANNLKYFFPSLKSRYLATLVLVDSRSDTYDPSLLNTISAAENFNTDVHCVVLSNNAQRISEQVAKIPAVKKVYFKSSDSLTHPLSEVVSSLIYELTQKNDEIKNIIAPGNCYFKSVIPRLAALFGVAPLSEVIEIIDNSTFLRPIYAGNVITKVHLEEPYKIMTIRTTMFSPTSDISTGSAEIEEIKSPIPDFPSTQWVSENLSTSDLPDLSHAKIIVSGGRAFKNKENFDLLFGLAKKLNAAVGASRAAVDAGFCTNDLQIGQTGKVVAPELYFAFGISGAIQHVSGMKDSKVIVCVNSDPECPMFEISDYCLVGDLFKIIPEIEKLLK